MTESEKREIVKKFLDDLGIDQSTAITVTIDTDLTVTAQTLYVRGKMPETVDVETHRLVKELVAAARERGTE